MNVFWKGMQVFFKNITKKENTIVFALIAIYTWIFVNPLKNAAMAMGTRIAPYTILILK